MVTILDQPISSDFIRWGWLGKRAAHIYVEVSQKVIGGVYNVVFDSIIIDCNAEL